MANEQVGKPIKFHKKFKFLVEIDGIPVAAFRKAGPLKAKIGVIKERQGGQIFPTKEPGLGEVDPITLERGVVRDMSLWLWFKEVSEIAANGGSKAVDDGYKRNLTIVQLSRSGKRLREHSCTGAFPTEFEAGDWDNNADENVTEKLVIEVDDFDMNEAIE